jgi:hypothetical protein
MLTGGALSLFIPRNNPYVSVFITNSTPSSIQTVRLETEDGQIYLLENLGVAETKTVRVFVRGESSYKMKATLGNGITLEGGAGYVESGYKVHEKILDDKIQSDYDFKGVY